MTKYCAYIILFLISFTPKAIAQDEIDYEDDINPYIIGDSINLIIPQMVNYLENHPEHAASNLQLARIYEYRYKNADYLIDYESAIANAKKAQQLYGNSAVLVDEKEIRKNEWYYPNFTDEFKKNGKPILNYGRIQAEISRGLIEADSFLMHMPKIQQNFMRMVAQYDLATKTFVRLNGEYNSLKDLYLLFDSKLNARLALLKNSYDSTLIYFKAYQEAAAKYPPFQVTQSLTFKMINTYRLDGLVIQTDFFQPQVELWEYNKWVDAVRDKINEEIKSLRINIDKIEETLSNNLKKLEEMSTADAINVDPINKKELYKIRKYDLNSPVANLFQYKDDKLDILYEQLLLKRFDTMSAVSPQLKLFAFNNLLQMVVDLSKATIAYREGLESSNLQKNASFYDTYYGGASGVSNYFKQEADWSNKLMKQTADSIKKQINAYNGDIYLNGPLAYRKTKLVYLSPSNPDAFDKPTNRITDIKKNVNQISYLTGYFFSKDSVRQVFIAGSKEKKVLWYNTVSPVTKGSTEWQQIGGVSITGGGDLSYQLYRRNADSLHFVNSIIKLDETGKILHELKVATEEQPVYLSGLRNSEMKLAVYQGDGFGQAVWPSTATIVKLHPDSSAYQMKTINVKGQFIGLFKLDKAVVFVAKSEDGQRLYLLKVDPSFELIAERTINFSNDQAFKTAYQISDQSLHIIADRGNAHVVINEELEVLYSASVVQNK